jgi:hypothetical protein
MSTRQERRRQERLAKKQGKGEKRYDMNVELIQPWSVPVFKTTLPPEILQTMIEISDQVIVDKETKSHGKYLAGQIDTELLVEHDILNQTGMMGFFMAAVRQFVIMCKCQQMPGSENAIKEEEWYAQMLTMWIISTAERIQPHAYSH